MRSESVPGAEISTALAPASRCAAAFSRAVKIPVHSSATSMPRSAQGKPRRVALAEHLDRPRADIDRAFCHLDRAGEAPVDRIVAQQVRVGLHVAQVVEGDDGEVGAAGFVNCAQDVAADPPESVDGDANRHAPSNG